jgi:ArsR family transcriptional regulator, arsenate/arsenite/antimonite-responsive transcriptional repressor
MIDADLFSGTLGSVPKPLPRIDPMPSVADCCGPLCDAPLSTHEAAELAVRMKALADPARLRLLSILLASPDEGACTCDVTETLGLSQPTVTHHLRKLLDAGLVTAERRGVSTYYRVVPDALAGLAVVLQPQGVSR